VRHLLLVGAYRDNEVSPSHSLLRTLDAIRKAGAFVQEISLAPLFHEDLERLIADTLSCAPDDATPLARLVHEKTGGSPFFEAEIDRPTDDQGKQVRIRLQARRTTLDQRRAIAVGRDYLRHLGIDWSPHPTEDEARREYDRIWSQLGSRTIEDLIELPLMSDPASLATLGCSDQARTVTARPSFLSRPSPKRPSVLKR
jgi:predicted ATPase